MGKTAQSSDFDLEKPRAIIFDWDNTLVDTWDIIHDAMNATLTTFARETWTLEETRRRVRRSMRDAFPEMFGDRWEEAGRCFYDRYRAVHLEKLKASEGAAAMLERLSGAGVYLGVVSNKLGEYLRQEADYLGWMGHFGRMVGALDAPRDKPAPDPVDMALAGSGVNRGPLVWFAGDTEIDLECAVNAECVPVLVRQDPPGAGEFKNCLPRRHFRNCQALCNLVLTL